MTLLEQLVLLRYWKPGWVETSTEEWRKKVNELVEQDRWIIEGNYSSSFDIRFPRADTIIILDYNPLLAIFRATKRILKNYKKTREDMAPDCPERFNWEFYKFIWNFNKVHRTRAQEAIEKYSSGAKVYTFRAPKDVETYLNSL